MATEFLLFVYGAFMKGEARHAELQRARFVGAAETEPLFELVDLGPEPALMLGGTSAVKGEVYAVAAAELAAMDVHHGHPLRYRRVSIPLADGQLVEAHTITQDQARGRRRIRGGDFRARLSGGARTMPESPWTRFARDRGRAPR